MKYKQYGECMGVGVGLGVRAINVVDSQTNTTFQPRRPSSVESVHG